MRVACLTSHQSRYRQVAAAMAAGIKRCGDEANLVPLEYSAKGMDCAVMYGWKRRHLLRRYPQFVYADLAYWRRDTHYRLSVGGWSPHKYVRAGLPADRLDALGVQVHPWRTGGDELLLVGASAKSMEQHGFRYMQWENAMARHLLKLGGKVVYRPKPSDPMRTPMNLDGVGYDERPINEALDAAACVITHHSNTAIDALAHGVPVYCEIGAGAAFSVARDQIPVPPQAPGREQFLADVAWLQWSVKEMESGAAWAHLKERGLIG